MSINTSPIIHIVVFVGVLLTGADICLAQNGSVAEMRTVLADAGKLAKEDFSALDKGKMFAKLLPVKDKRELAVIGIIGLDSPLEDGRKGFDQAISRQLRKGARAFGKFSNPPKLTDFSSMTLKKSEIEDLRRCTVGN